MASLSERLAAVKAKLANGREDNLKVVGIETDTFSAIQSTAVPSSELRGKASGLNKRKRPKHISEKTLDVGSADEADEENNNERFRSMKRRSKALSRPTSVNYVSDRGDTKLDKEKRVEDSIHDVDEDEIHGEPTMEKLVYGGEGRVDEHALDDMVSELQDVEKRRAKYQRRRAFDEDRADITFINEGNRLFNRTLDRHFNKFESVKKIQDNLERGTA